MTRAKTLALVLAGGEGSRLAVLTDVRAKPALPFGGAYRLIDVPLSNLAHSGLSDVWVVEQYRPHWLNEYIANGRPWDLDRTRGGLRILPPFEGRHGEGFAAGNAEALHQHASFLREYGADHVLVLSADHLYRMDYRDLVERHVEVGADLTMVTTRVHPDDASRFGVVRTDAQGRVTGFSYKPDEPDSDEVTTEIFLFDRSVLLDSLDSLARSDEGLGDYGDQLVPQLVDEGNVWSVELEGYWRDLGTVESYWQAHADLLDGTAFRLDGEDWPLLSGDRPRLPAWIRDGAEVVDSMISSGCEIGGKVVRSVLSPGVTVEHGASVWDSVVLEDAVVCSGARVERTVLDAGASVRSGAQVGGGDAVSVVGMDVTVDGDVDAGTHLSPDNRDPSRR